jgi:cell division protein FtsZ
MAKKKNKKNIPKTVKKSLIKPIKKEVSHPRKKSSSRKVSSANSAPRKLFVPNRDTSNLPVVKIKVVGIGGCGNNAVSRMYGDFPRGVEFIALNTDLQDLEKTNVRNRINIGRNLTKGMGSGMNPDVGRQSAEESRAEIIEALQGADLVFLTAGMGGGTGTGATPIIAEAAREIGALTVAVVTKPFAFEGSQRTRVAEEGVFRLRDKVDSLIVIPNDRIFSIIGNDTSINKAFLKIDEVLKNTVQGISEIISIPGLVNVDFADIRAIMQGAGAAIVGVGQASGADRAIKSATQAINSPLLERSVEGSRGVLFGISGGVDMKMSEINEAAKIITENVDPNAKIIFGAYYDRKVPKGNIKINLIATGFNGLSSAIREREKDIALFSPTRFADESLSSEKQAVSPLKVTVKPKDEEESKSGLKEETPDLFKKDKLENLFTSGEIGRDMEKEEGEEKGDNMWDIPAFLRRKKRK